MSLIKKLFNKKQEVLFQKNQIFLYADNSADLELRDEKDYFVFGCYNDDRSQFTNLGTGEVYNLNTTYGNTLSLNVKGRSYSVTSGFGYVDFIGEDLVLRINAYAIRNKDFLIDSVAIDYKNQKSESFKKLNGLYNFLTTDVTDNISLKEIQKTSSQVNDYAYDAIAKELNKSQNINV